MISNKKSVSDAILVLERRNTNNIVYTLPAIPLKSLNSLKQVCNTYSILKRYVTRI
jgi:hypothetical protein